MKTISEIRKTATVLNRKALKNLLGGNPCGDQNGYWCTVSMYGASSWSGVACGNGGKMQTQAELIRELNSQGLEGFRVDC